MILNMLMKCLKTGEGWGWKERRLRETEKEVGICNSNWAQKLESGPVEDKRSWVDRGPGWSAIVVWSNQADGVWRTPITHYRHLKCLKWDLLHLNITLGYLLEMEQGNWPVMINPKHLWGTWSSVLKVDKVMFCLNVWAHPCGRYFERQNWQGMWVHQTAPLLDGLIPLGISWSWVSPLHTVG